MEADQSEQFELTEEEKAREDRRAAAAELRNSVGSRCELRNHDNNLIFLGRIHSFDGTAITIYSAAGRELPPVIFNTEFKLIIRIPGRPALVWGAQVCGSTPGFWKLDHLVRFHFSEHRSHFRQPVSIPARVTKIENPLIQAETAPTDCRILDISLGGIQLKSRERFERGDWLQVSDAMLASKQPRPFSFTGQVCWADRQGGGEFLFGVRFAPMGMGEQDRLCSAIFSLQRMDLQSHRD